MMASRGRAALLKKQMEEEGTDWKLLDEIHTPVGMPINAETPEEIAISIVSELIHEKNSLRKTSGYKKELMEYLTGRKKAENGMALATIIERRGSAPREIGTKMLVLADGTLVGTRQRKKDLSVAVPYRYFWKFCRFFDKTFVRKK